MNQEQIISALKHKGVSVVGTTEEFNGSKGGVWICAEATPDMFDYWSEAWTNTFGVDPKLDSFVEDNGWYFEWHDAGTIMLWAN